MAFSPHTISRAQAARDRWVNDPVLFAKEVLGITPWHRQAEMLRAVVKHKRVAVKAGQKVSKSCTAAIICYWFAMTRPRAKVICSSSSYDQLRDVIWTELRERREATYRTKMADGVVCREAGIAPLGGEWHDDPATGVQFFNGSSITGGSTNSPMRAAGRSGPDMQYVLDESTGIEDEIFEAFDGNTAGGGGIFAISNPTSTSGWFYDAFQEGSSWHQLTISSEEAAAVTPRIPGLATAEYLAQKALPTEWGRGSTIWNVRVEGKFPERGAGGVFSLDLIGAAEKRWSPACNEDGPLRIGVDVAGTGTDSTCIVWSRGSWSSIPIVLHNVEAPEIVEQVVELCRTLLRPGEKASVRVDSTSIGHGVFGYLKRETMLMDVVGVESHAGSPDPTCWRMRDAVYLSLQRWLTTGAIAKERRLRDDLLAPKLEFAPDGKWKIESKPNIRKRIGRSTDRSDALGLAVFDNAPTPADSEWIPGSSWLDR